MKIYPVILSGGATTRLWPLSRGHAQAAAAPGDGQNHAAGYGPARDGLVGADGAAGRVRQ
ncbi:hypothetical protein LP420_08000 [Massilia sp. B-10]|nr:hypothetical protein LP420_08000 [Massilia sp. B-10]